MTGNAPGTNAQDTYEFTNTNKWDTRQLVTMALMCAIGVLLSFVEFPLLPGVTWLKYDASAMPVMNILVVAGFILPAALVYRRSRTFKSGVVGLVLSAITATVMAILGNLVITPMWLGVPLDAVVAMILPILTPFNLIKAGINAVLTLIVYKSISNLITPKKKQVKGR